MAFIQIIEFSSSRIEEIAQHGEQYRQDTEGKTTAGRSTVAADRDNPNRYFVIVEFDSYEAAMENSNLPETQALAQKMRELADGPPTFHNLDVIQTM